MEFLLTGEGYSIPDAIPMNNSPPASTSASGLGFHRGENSQLLDGFLQSHQKTNNPADSERVSRGETEGFMISRNGAQSDRVQLRRPSASLSVNGVGTAKVSKKRSRASKKAPTTLFNTDTANFRAMVQRFTGIPEIPLRFSSMNPNPTFSPHVGQQGLELVGKPLPYKAVLDPNFNYVSHLNSPPDGYGPRQYNRTTFVPFQFLHDNKNISNPLNLFSKAAQGQSANATPPNDVGLINSASVLPTPSLRSPSDRWSAIAYPN